MEVMGKSNVPPPAANGSLTIGYIRVYFGAIFRPGVTCEPNRRFTLDRAREKCHAREAVYMMDKRERK